ncbi:MAG: CHAT domain-containing protein, partial [Casimicrobium sp.]
APLLMGKARLLVVAHSSLHYVPFAALEFDGAALVDSFEIVMLSSASALLSNSTTFADCDDSRRALLVGSSQGSLAHVSDELAALASIFPSSDRFMDESATVDRVSRAMPTARIVHLACHGQFRADSPYFSALHFADGAITVRDIGEMRLSADLVTLSACETGLSQLSPGDELLGLTRAFLRAGAKNVVNSLWAVDDAVTSSLMTLFYRSIAKGESAARALRNAQIATRSQHPHPYYWAGFTVTGRP